MPIRQFLTSNQKHITLITDISWSQPFTSLTNSIESIIAELKHQGHLITNSTIIEHLGKEFKSHHIFHEVQFDEELERDWTPMDITQICNLLEVNEEYFDEKGEREHIQFQQIERLHHQLFPLSTYIRTEKPAVVERRLKIEESKISKQEFLSFLDTNSKEKDLHQFLNGDLSLVAELGRVRSERWIVYSEFQLGTGRVDFAVFHGSSCMEVTLIEIKGANYNFQNQSGRKSLNFRTNEAFNQMIERIRLIHKAYSYHRLNIHQIREKTESDNYPGLHLRGPQQPLMVDPNKDIELRGIIVGGRRNDDLMENQLRKSYEENQNIPVRMESWDSWINKLDR